MTSRPLQFAVLFFALSGLMPVAAQVLPATGAPSVADSRPAASAVPSFDLSAVQDGYMLGPGDRVNLLVFGVESMSGTQIVLPDGTVSLPLIGAVVAINRTPADLAVEIERRLSAYLKNPRVGVTLQALRPLRISVSGEVLQPGPRQLQNLLTAIGTAGSNTLPTVTSALAGAGGVTNRADVSTILLRRRLPNGQESERRIDLWRTLQEGRIEEDVFLKDGDALFVPQCVDCPVDPRVLAYSTLAPGKIRVRVFGEVNKSGSLELDGRATVIDAVASAGGLSNLAAPDNVEIVSIAPDGRVTNKVINVNAAINGDKEQNIQLRDQDSVIVRRSIGGDILSGLNVIANPIGTVANLFFIFRNFRNY